METTSARVRVNPTLGTPFPKRAVICSPIAPPLPKLTPISRGSLVQPKVSELRAVSTTLRGDCHSRRHRCDIVDVFGVRPKL